MYFGTVDGVAGDGSAASEDLIIGMCGDNQYSVIVGDG